MLNYYDEIRNAILEVLEEEGNAKDILQSGDDKDIIIENLIDYLRYCDYVTGNASGSYYCNAYNARKQCYNYSSTVIEALEDFGYKNELELFKTFEFLVDEGYLNIENMTLDDELLDEVNEDERCYAFYALEEIENLSFETLDVITRCYMLSEVLKDVLNAIL